MKKVETITIELSSEKTPREVADALRVIAKDIDEGYIRGIAGWSDVTWEMEGKQWITEQKNSLKLNMYYY